jgi:hypothetical protein
VELICRLFLIGCEHNIRFPGQTGDYGEQKASFRFSLVEGGNLRLSPFGPIQSPF